eukprot:11222982-Lingulodinium_polyedra.AAC.1
MRSRRWSVLRSHAGPAQASRLRGTSSAAQMSSVMAAQHGKRGGIGRSWRNWHEGGNPAAAVV